MVGKNIKYKFIFPKKLVINKNIFKNFIGGECSSKNTILLYGYLENEDICIDEKYIEIIEHEHLHALLLSYEINTVNKHHFIIDIIKLFCNNEIIKNEQVDYIKKYYKNGNHPFSIY